MDPARFLLATIFAWSFLSDARECIVYYWLDWDIHFPASFLVYTKPIAWALMLPLLYRFNLLRRSAIAIAAAVAILAVANALHLLYPNPPLFLRLHRALEHIIRMLPIASLALLIEHNPSQVRR